MYPIGQILNFDNWREFQNTKTEHINATVHKEDAINASVHIKIHENGCGEVAEFIDKYITCVLPDETNYPEMSK